MTQLLQHEIDHNAFLANILNENELDNKKFIADIIITDIPYGNLANWSNNDGDEINKLLDTIISIINSNTVIAISHNKNQKINTLKYKIIERMTVGHRKIEILKLT
jgi:tRNA G10  N-methylase Trm11